MSVQIHRGTAPISFPEAGPASAKWLKCGGTRVGEKRSFRAFSLTLLIQLFLQEQSGTGLGVTLPSPEPEPEPESIPEPEPIPEPD